MLKETFGFYEVLFPMSARAHCLHAFMRVERLALPKRVFLPALKQYPIRLAGNILSSSVTAHCFEYSLKDTGDTVSVSAEVFVLAPSLCFRHLHNCTVYVMHARDFSSSHPVTLHVFQLVPRSVAVSLLYTYLDALILYKYRGCRKGNIIRITLLKGSAEYLKPSEGVLLTFMYTPIEPLY